MSFAARDDLLACVHCGLCLTSCPTYLELGLEADSPRGRIYLMRALDAGELHPSAEVIHHLDACLGCRACETACPSGVRYGALIEAARPYVEVFRPGRTRRLRRVLATLLTTGVLRRAALVPVRPIRGAAWLGRLGRRLASPWLAYAAALPRSTSVRLPALLEPHGPTRGTAVLVTGCVADTLFPRTNLNTALLLQHAGLRVVVPRAQGCCGALPMHLGQAARARALARALGPTLVAPGPDWIVSNAAGCGALLREYDHLLGDDRDARAIARRSRDALELISELGLPPAGRSLDRTVAIHDPCHLAHGQGVRAQVRRLLADVPGVRLVELEESDTCCGSAGTYNLTEPAMAARLRERKLDRIAASGADVIAAANPGCILQMRAGAILRGLAVRIEHPLDLLAEAHGVGLS